MFLRHTNCTSLRLYQVLWCELHIGHYSFVFFLNELKIVIFSFGPARARIYRAIMLVRFSCVRSWFSWRCAKIRSTNINKQCALHATSTHAGLVGLKSLVQRRALDTLLSSTAAAATAGEPNRRRARRLRGQKHTSIKALSVIPVGYACVQPKKQDSFNKHILKISAPPPILKIN